MLTFTLGSNARVTAIAVGRALRRRTVRLLAAGDPEPAPDAPWHVQDRFIVDADELGLHVVNYPVAPLQGPYGPTTLIRWEDVDRVHVY